MCPTLCLRLPHFLLPLLMVGWLLSTPVSAQQWARDMFGETTHDFGSVAAGSETSFTFEFTNKYKETVHVKAVRSTCGCTIPSVVNDTVKSREKSGIVATFNTKAFTGSRAAKITVEFDRPFFAEVELNVRGTILTDVNFEPSKLAFGEIAQGDPAAKTLKVTFLNRSNLKINDVRSLCTDLSVKLIGPQKSGASISYDLDVKLKPTIPAGVLNTSLTLLTNDPSLTNIVVPVEARVRAPLEVKPESLHFGPLALGGKDSQRLLLRADTEFKVTKVTCADPRLSFQILSDKEAKLHFVKVDFADNSEAPSTFKFPIEIETTLEGQPKTTCIVTGEIK